MRKLDADVTNYSSIRVVGDFLPPDFIKSLVCEENRASKTSQNVELYQKWEQTRDKWKKINKKADGKGLDEQAVVVFLEFVFGSILEFSDLESCDGVHTDERIYPITHLALQQSFPIWLSPKPIEEVFSKQGCFVGRRSPFSLMQQYVNDEGCKWGILAEYSCIRLVRTNPSLSRHSYIEFDLASLFEEGGVNEFNAFWVLMNESRFQSKKSQDFSTDWDRWCKEGLQAGQRIREGMRVGVGKALEVLGQGFLEHSKNTKLRKILSEGDFSVNQYHTQILRLTYRLIFLFFLEDRNLLHPPRTSKQTLQLYFEGYSLSKLRDRSLKHSEYDKNHDLWLGLCIIFKGLCQGDERLVIPGLGGLFDSEQCKLLDSALIDNDHLLQAIHHLSYFQSGQSLSKVNYRDMGAEEIGSIYESLLELHPNIDINSWLYELIGLDGEAAKGNKRKLTGSYYTPKVLVDAVLDSSLQPIVDKTVKNNPNNAKQALLKLRIVDPACGSGHFLLAAAHRLAASIATLDIGEDAIAEELDQQLALRQVVRHCIYGVDINSLAVELCRIILWMESIVPGKPLPFLEANIRCGDSLTGIFSQSEFEDGIPDAAYKPHKMDDKDVCKKLRERNKKQRGGEMDLFERKLGFTIDSSEANHLAELPEDNLTEIHNKRKAWENLRTSPKCQKWFRKANLLYAALFAPKTKETEQLVPTNNDLIAVDKGLSPREGVEEFCQKIAEESRFFHWAVEFSTVMNKGGFDVVIGNPPWEVMTLKEQEFFASRDPRIGKLPGDKRKKEIQKLKDAKDPLFDEFLQSKRRYDYFNSSVKIFGRYPLLSKGQTNLYQLFSELALNLVSRSGRAGIIVPSGIATDWGNRFYIQELTASKRLISLYDFENKLKLFPIHSSYKFSLLTMGHNTEKVDAAFYLHHPNQLKDDRRHIALTDKDLALVNPNSKTFPLCRSWMDFQIMKKIYSTWPVFVDESKESKGNPWGVSFSRMFDMTTDSNLFRTASELEKVGAKLDGNAYVEKKGKRWLPLYEAKMMHIYDHRWGTYQGVKGDCIDVDPERKKDPNYRVIPRYWVPEEDVLAKLEAKGWDKQWLMGWRSISCGTNQRTLITSILPINGVGNSMTMMFVGQDASISCGLLACFNSLVSDFLIRLKAGGTNLNFYILNQLPFPSTGEFTAEILSFIVPRVIKLIYTTNEMQFFAQDIGYEGPPYKIDDHGPYMLRAELDAFIAYWYGLSREELQYILDPKEVYGVDFPSETFTALKNAELKEFGEYLTKRLTLEAWDCLFDTGKEHLSSLLASDSA